MVAQAYTSKLNDVFDRIFVHGVAEIARADLLLWHDGQKRVTKKLWRNFNEAWAARCQTEWEYEEGGVPQLLRAYNGATLKYYIIWSGELDATGKFESWFKPITEVDEAEENETAA